MKWIMEIEKAGDMKELADSASIIGCTDVDFERLDSKIARGLTKILNGDFKKRVLIEEDKYQEHHAQMLIGRQIAYMIYSHFRLTEVDGAVLEITDLLKVELKKDNVRAFDTAWDETLLGMASVPEEHYLEALYLRQLEKSEQLQNPLALYVQDHVQRGEPKSYAKLRKMVRSHLDHQTRENTHRTMRKVKRTWIGKPGES